MSNSPKAPDTFNRRWLPLTADVGVEQPETGIGQPGSHTGSGTRTAQFVPETVPSHAEEKGWVALAERQEPASFVLTWVPLSSAPEEAPPTPEHPEQPEPHEQGQEERLQQQLQEQLLAGLQAQFEAQLQEQTERLMRVAEQQAERLKEEAYAAGYAAGEQRGFDAGQGRLEALLQRLGQTLREVGGLRAQIFVESEQQLLELALAIARKVLHQESRIDPHVIVTLLQVGIKAVTQRQELRLKVHPADMLFTASCKPQLLSCLDGIDSITLEDDDTVPPGSCVVETPAEIVDLRWESQLEEVAASLFKAKDSG